MSASHSNIISSCELTFVNNDWFKPTIIAGLALGTGCHNLINSNTFLHKY